MPGIISADGDITLAVKAKCYQIVKKHSGRIVKEVPFRGFKQYPDGTYYSEECEQLKKECEPDEHVALVYA